MKQKIELMVVFDVMDEKTDNELKVLERILRTLGEIDQVVLGEFKDGGGMYNQYAFKMKKKYWRKVGEFMGCEPAFVGDKDHRKCYAVHL